MIILEVLIVLESILFCLNWHEFVTKRGKD